MKNRIKRLIVFSLLIFSILVSSTSVFAAEKTININLKGEKNEGIDFSNRKLIIWKISNNYNNIDREALAEKLKPMSNSDLNKIYLDPIYSKKSDADGKISISLDKGTYYAREVDNSNKVKIYPFVFVVDEEDNIIIIPKSGEEKPPNKTKLIKVSSNNLKLANAEFELYREVDNKLERVPLKDKFYSEKGSKDIILTTDSNGEIDIYNLPKGKYMFKEIKAPEGYSIRQSETYFNVDGEDIEVKIINFKEGDGGFKFKKVSEDEMPLSKAKFMVTKKENGFFNKIDLDGKNYVVSDDDGYFTVENLPYGDYYLWEVEPPKGYSSISSSVKFVIDENSFGKLITIIDKRIPNAPPEIPIKNPPKPLSKIPPKPLSKIPPKGIEPKKPLINIPKTGDITLILMILAGVAFVTFGYGLVKEDSVK